MTQPTIGRTVLYKLGAADVDHITAARAKRSESSLSIGNAVSAGDVYPATIVRVFDPRSGCANLQVTLDGIDTYWATSRVEGDGEFNWSWPTLV